MASKYGAVRAAIATAVATAATLSYCGDSAPTKKTTFPYAWLTFSQAEYEVSSGNSELLIKLPFSIEVHGKNDEQVQTAVEAIDGLWLFSDSALTALQAAGAQFCYPQYCALPQASGESDKHSFAVLEMMVQIGRTS